MAFCSECNRSNKKTMPHGKRLFWTRVHLNNFNCWCVYLTLTFVPHVSDMIRRWMLSLVTWNLFFPTVFSEQTLLEEHITLSLNKLCSDVHHTTFQFIFSPISVQLEQVQFAPAWNSANKQAVTCSRSAWLQLCPTGIYYTGEVGSMIRSSVISLQYTKQLFYKPLLWLSNAVFCFEARTWTEHLEPKEEVENEDVTKHRSLISTQFT
jgi:hypothetical protein